MACQNGRPSDALQGTCYATTYTAGWPGRNNVTAPQGTNINDELLSSTGLADAATLAARFDIDIRTPAFWRASLDIIRADIAQFEELVGS